MHTFLSTLAALCLLLSSIHVGDATSGLMDATNEPTTFIVVRHAEKADNSADPDLSESGAERAKRLAEVLQYMSIDGLHSTPYKRTRQTLGKLSENLGLEVNDYDPRNPNPFLDGLKANYGTTHVIAGHSNTAPRIVNYLSGESVYNDLEDHVYDHLWIVHCYPDGSTKTVLLHF